MGLGGWMMMMIIVIIIREGGVNIHDRVHHGIPLLRHRILDKKWVVAYGIIFLMERSVLIPGTTSINGF